jgi:ADP-ribosylglycohydrolase
MNARERSWLSLAGLSVGDAFGDRFFLRDSEVAMRLIAERALPSAPWPYTDDTQMALSIVEILWEHGEIDQDDLARRYADRVEYRRGYGKGAYDLLVAIKEGRDWRALSQNSFRGMGSFGNGAAMRVAPLGAFFADRPLDFISKQAALSSEVTHAHPEGIAGGIAIAVAAALAWRQRGEAGPLGRAWLQSVCDAVPAGYTKDAIDEALTVPPTASIVSAAETILKVRSGKQSAPSAIATRPAPSSVGFLPSRPATTRSLLNGYAHAKTFPSRLPSPQSPRATFQAQATALRSSQALPPPR